MCLLEGRLKVCLSLYSIAFVVMFVERRLEVYV